MRTPATFFEDDARSFAALLQHLATGPAHLMGFSDGGEISLLMAALTPGVARSVVTWGAAGVLNDPSGQLREAMYNVVDHPIPPLQQFRDYLVSTYGEANARAMTQSTVDALSDIIRSAAAISVSRRQAVSPALCSSSRAIMTSSPHLRSPPNSQLACAWRRCWR